MSYIQNGMNTETKTCQNCRQPFVIEPEDFAFYEKMKVPAPTWCPECRLQRRFMFRNERHLYKRPCGLCQKPMLATFSLDKPRAVYCGPCWWSDQWDALSYGKPYDFSRPFFSQLDELFRTVPLQNLGNNYPALVNSDYINESNEAKNCYLIFDTDYCENVCYGTRLTYMKDSLDLFVARESELCYDVVNCRKSSRLFFSEDCSGCVDVYCSKNLIGCQNCFGCAGLRNKSYCFWNRQLTRDDYRVQFAALKEELSSVEGLARLRARAAALWLTVPYKYYHGFTNVNVSGDYIYQSKNVRDSFQCRGLENGRYCQLLKDETTKDAYDYTIWGAGAESIYECMNIGAGVNNAKFSYVCALGNTMNTEYSTWCIDVANVFGCSGLRKKKYCILNKQYTKEKYETLVPKIKEHMNAMPYADAQGRVYTYGEFFPYDLSFYDYNETNAIEYFPLPKEGVLARGWRWRDETPLEHPITMRAEELPSQIADVTDSVLKEVIQCGTCGRGYQIVPAELAFLRRFSFPLPQACSQCRHQRRFDSMNPMRLWRRSCMCEQKGHAHAGRCPNEFETSYSPARPEIVYCESCYNAEVA